MNAELADIMVACLTLHTDYDCTAKVIQNNKIKKLHYIATNYFV